MSELTYRKLSAFFNDISLLISAAFSTADSLREMEHSAEDPEDRALCGRMAAVTEEGSSLWEAMADSGAFPSYAVRMVESGARAGRLEEVTASLSRYYDRQEELGLLVSSVLTKPMILLLLLSVILAVFLFAVLPLLAGVCRELSGGAGPYITAAYVVGSAAFLAVFAVLIYLSDCFSAREGAGRGRALPCFCPRDR